MRKKTSAAIVLPAMLIAGLAHAAEPIKDGLYAELQTTKGKIVLQLEFEKTPMTVANFVGLAEGTKDSNKPKGTKFYDGLVFHRVIADFMIQGGCPEGSGTGGPGYKFGDEIHGDLKHVGEGILSMANAGPATNGSQFFITHRATPHLDGKHTVFGQVIEGQKVVNAIEKGDTLKTITIVRVGDKAKAFKADEATFKTLATEAAERPIKDVLAKLKKDFPNAELITSKSGLKHIVSKDGAGAKAGKGRKIKAHYTGKLLTGAVFDSSVRRGEPFEFTVGVGEVIPGWDEALSDMKKGEKRVLIIPPGLAYGARGAGGVIPPNATLVFEVELVDF